MCQWGFLCMKSRAYASTSETRIRTYLSKMKIWSAEQIECVVLNVFQTFQSGVYLGVCTLWECPVGFCLNYTGIEGEKAPKPWKTVLVECHHEVENKSFRLSRKACQAKAVRSGRQNECFFYLNSCIAKNSRGRREQGSNSRTNGESIWLEELKEKSSLSFFFLKSGTIFEAFIDKNSNDCF